MLLLRARTKTRTKTREENPREMSLCGISNFHASLLLNQQQIPNANLPANNILHIDPSGLASDPRRFKIWNDPN